MSTWRFKTDEGELGPVSFKELADLVREGKVKEGALVRREGASNWEPAWHVPGLLTAAGMGEPGDSIQNPKSKIQNPKFGRVAGSGDPATTRDGDRPAVNRSNPKSKI
jgi:GYF domain 2